MKTNALRHFATSATIWTVDMVNWELGSFFVKRTTCLKYFTQRDFQKELDWLLDNAKELQMPPDERKHTKIKRKHADP